MSGEDMKRSSVYDPLLTPVLGEVFSSLVPLRYKGSESVS